MHNSQEELLETTWKRLAEAGRVAGPPPPSLVKERFCMKLEKDEYAAAVSSINMKEVMQEPFSKTAWLNLFKENAGRFRSESLVGLMREATILTAKTEIPNPVLLNLLASCKEFLRTHRTVAEISLTGTATAPFHLKWP